MKKATLKQRAERLFAKKAHKKLWANPRGEFFTSENLGNLSLKKGETLIPFEPDATLKSEPSGSNPEDENFMNAKDTIAAIEDAKSLDELKGFEGDERVTVQRAYKAKHAELLAAVQVNEEQQENAGQKPAESGEEE